MSTAQWRSIIAKVMLLGFAMVAFGLWFNSFADDDPAAIECDGKRMSAGDSCTTYTRGSARTESYEQLVASKTRSVAWNQTYPLPIAGLGALVIVGSGVVLFVLRDSADPAGAADDTGTGNSAGGATASASDWWYEGDRP